MSRAPLVVANWKMYKTPKEAASFIETLKNELPSFSKRVWIAPPFISIESCVRAVGTSPISIGAQNVHQAKEGAFTGEVSAEMVKAAGAHFVIVGHSERRLMAGETDRVVNEKLKSSFTHQLVPILCIGESLEERERGQARDVWKRQLEGALQGVSESDAAQLIIAYEPIWAIGTGKVAKPETAQEALQYVRSFIEQKFGSTCAQKAPLLYGGSVKAESMPSFMQQTDIDGVLVGGASLEVRSLIRIIEA